MPRFSYVNGSYVPHNDAFVHIEDRGFQFADGAYEVIAYVNGHLADERGHLDRFERSLSELQMDLPVRRPVLQLIMRELIRKNRLTGKNALLYVQATRGRARRDFAFPDKDTPMSLVMTIRPFQFENTPRLQNGIKVITIPDIRWKRRDIKSVALLPQVLAKQTAIDHKASEAWMVDDDGLITEGSSSNAWIVTKDKTVVTRKATNDILRGVTRTAIISLFQEAGLKLEERSFKKEECYQAIEAFTTSGGALIVPVIEIDGQTIGDGKPGPVVKTIYDTYMQYVTEDKEQVSWKA